MFFSFSSTVSFDVFSKALAFSLSSSASVEGNFAKVLKAHVLLLDASYSFAAATAFPKNFDELENFSSIRRRASRIAASRCSFYFHIWNDASVLN